MHTIKPLDSDAVIEHVRGCDLVVTVEEHTVVGGLGSAVLDALVRYPFPGLSQRMQLRLTHDVRPEERRLLRQHIEDAVRELYKR